MSSTGADGKEKKGVTSSNPNEGSSLFTKFRSVLQAIKNAFSRLWDRISSLFGGKPEEVQTPRPY